MQIQNMQVNRTQGDIRFRGPRIFCIKNCIDSQFGPAGMRDYRMVGLRQREPLPPLPLRFNDHTQK
jgi:hypothetical protein